MIVCTIGGGSGMPIVNKALVKAGYKNIHSIVTTFDSGGDSGRMRTDERGRILAFSDYWRSLISLWEDGEQKEVWQEMLRFRDGRSRNFGNIFFQFMAEKEGNFSEVDRLFAKLTGANIMGEVIPVSTVPADVCFKTMSGKEFCGEHYLDQMRMSLDRVEHIWLCPEVDANPEAVEAIKAAKVIIMCPGSMYGSVITNLLPKGIKQAYAKSKAKKVLMTNLMSVANENRYFSQNDYVDEFKKYLAMKKPFDLVLMADWKKLDQKLLKKTVDSYVLEHSEPIIRDTNGSDFKTMTADIAKIEEVNLRLRHSATKLSEFFNSREWLNEIC